MRIVIITPYADPEKGAAVIRVNAFKNYFEDKGHKVEIFAPERNDAGKAAGVIRYKNRKEMLGSLGKYDVVIGTSTLLYDIFRAMLFCKRRRIKFVMDSKEPFVHTYSKIGGFSGKKLFFYKKIEKLLYKFSDAVFILTEANRNYVIRKFKANSKKLFLVPNGTQPEKIWRDEAEGKKIRGKLGISGNSIVLIYTGGLGDEEITQFMEKSAGVIKNHNIELLFVITGKQEEIDEIKTAAKKCNIEKRLRIIRNVEYSDMYKYLSAADIGILPWPSGLIYSMPIKVLDYMAAELPLLAKGPSEGSLKDFFGKYDVGFYSTDWYGFEKNLEKTLEKIKEFKAKGKAGRKIVQKEFDRKLFSKKALEIIGSLVKKH